jgi:pimeloyl-ACP methyl ester carboxylesterase
MKLYHEMHGEGDPLVLLHGGLMTIGEMAPLIQALAGHRKVIAVELQGHGRTADTDRPLKLETRSDDIAALIEHLGLGHADIVGYSLGGDVALRTAIQHPDRVRRLVVLSTPFARNGWYPEVPEGMAQVNSTMAHQLREVRPPRPRLKIEPDSVMGARSPFQSVAHLGDALPDHQHCGRFLGRIGSAHRPFGTARTERAVRASAAVGIAQRRRRSNKVPDLVKNPNSGIFDGVSH